VPDARVHGVTPSHWIAAYDFVGGGINHRKDVLILKVEVNLARNWVILRHPGLAIEMQSFDDFVLLHIKDRFRVAPLVGNIHFVKRRGVSAAIRFLLRVQFFDDLHLPQINHVRLSGRQMCCQQIMIVSINRQIIEPFAWRPRQVKLCQLL
jgi:hypothetical protein